MNASNWITLTGVMTTSAAFLFGLLQYSRSQKWRRAEFAAKEFKEFKSTPIIADAMLMLDWNHRIYKIEKNSYPFELSEKEEKQGGKGEEYFSIVVDDTVLANALVHHSHKERCPSPERRQPGFTLPEVYVRDAFDEFLEGLQMFENFIESRLVSEDNFRPYLFYWLDIIGNKNNHSTKPDWCRSNIWHYIDAYGYKSVQKLCSRFGYDISVQETKAI